ncbi:MAG: hypothetical protein K2X38_14240 [Gemmataceae bacterium]|nr:hypothetical protein [Gemmataceae bacterium]
MQSKHGKDGLVVLTVAVDDIEERELVLSKLKERKIGLANLFLHEPPELWQKKLRFDASPCVYLFDRNGRWEMFSGEEETQKADAIARNMLKEKAP